MPKFSFDPPPEARGYGLPMVRTPANGVLRLACVSESMIGCPTHWFGGRTVPCEAIDCKPCSEGVPWRWHGYVAGLLHDGRRLALFEFTAQAAESINEYKAANGTLRGAIINARRHRNRHNGRVMIDTHPGDLFKLQLPKAPDLIRVLSVLWCIPTPSMPTQECLTRKCNIQVHQTEGTYSNDPILIAEHQRRSA